MRRVIAALRGTLRLDLPELGAPRDEPLELSPGSLRVRIDIYPHTTRAAGDQSCGVFTSQQVPPPAIHQFPGDNLGFSHGCFPGDQLTLATDRRTYPVSVILTLRSVVSAEMV
jgi:hypothetical protein